MHPTQSSSDRNFYGLRSQALGDRLTVVLRAMLLLGLALTLNCSTDSGPSTPTPGSYEPELAPAAAAPAARLTGSGLPASPWGASVRAYIEADLRKAFLDPTTGARILNRGDFRTMVLDGEVTLVASPVEVADTASALVKTGSRDWGVRYRLAALATADEVLALSPGVATHADATMAIDRDGVVREEYENLQDHVEQRFIVEWAPAADFTLQAELETGLGASLATDGSLVLASPEGELLRATAPRAWDALGAELETSFALRPGGLDIHVSGTGAFPVLVDPLWSSVGDNLNGAQFGGSVASAGDVNNDTYDDVIVGARRVTPFSDAGKAYVFHGSATGLATVPDWTAQGDTQSGARFGSAVSSAGDVNGDGFDDVIVGAWGSLSGPPSILGKVFVYHGSASGLSATPDWSNTGDGQAYARYGFSVSFAGDVNNDTYDDVIVGAPAFDSTSSNVGKAYIYLGSMTGLANTPVGTSVGDDQGGALYGFSVSGGGNVNGDAFDDIIVGAPSATGTSMNSGRAYIYHGSAAGPGNEAWSSSGEDQAIASFGTSVSFAGNVNNDAYDDVVVGAPNYDTTVADAGRAYLFPGSASGAATMWSWVSSGPDVSGSGFGSSASTAGDVNGDGFDDLIIGAPLLDAAGVGVQEGGAFLFFGSAGGPSTVVDWALLGSDYGTVTRFGWSVAPAGDTDGDGEEEFLVGAPTFSPAAGPGTAFLFGGIPPRIVHIHSVDDTTIHVWFDEPMDNATATDTGNYLVDGTVSPTLVIQSGFDPAEVTLYGLTGLTPGAISTLVSSAEDLSGNPPANTADYYVGILPMSAAQADDGVGLPILDPAAFFTVAGWSATNVFSTSTALIYDLTGGLTVFDSSTASSLNEGVAVRVSGLINSFNGLAEIGTGSGSTRRFGAATVEDLPVLCLDVPTYVGAAESYEGLLLGFEDLSRTGGAWPGAGFSANLTFQDAGGTPLTVRIDSDTDIDGSAEPGWPLNVVAVAGQFDSSSPYFAGYQVLPRALSDFGAAVCPCGGNNTESYWHYPGAGVCVVNVCLPNFGDCNVAGVDGCEADFMNDSATCGDCTTTCAVNEACSAGSCVPACVVTPGLCDDGDACNGTETCDAVTGCQAGTPLTCDDGNMCNGAESCSPATGCVAGTPLTCDDGDMCNGAESCSPATGCAAGTPLTCDDGDMCTTDSCSPATGCMNVSNGSCTDAGAPGTDSGTPGTDSGTPGTDSGAPGTDSGAPGTDSSVPGTDSGSPGTDMGVPGTDSGTPGTDMGVPGTDSGVGGGGGGCRCHVGVQTPAERPTGSIAVMLLFGAMVLVARRRARRISSR